MEIGVRKLQDNPRETANLISVIFFGWSIPLFKQTYNKILNACDSIAPLREDRSEALGDQIEK